MSAEQWCQMRAVDALFFRDGTPFNRGEDHGDISSVFPPVPHTLSGAMRFALARANGWSGKGSWCEQRDDAGRDFAETLGDGPDDLRQLRFFGPLLALDRESDTGTSRRSLRLFFPMPRHVIGFTERYADGSAPTFHPDDWLVPGEPRYSDACDKPVAFPTPATRREKPPFAEPTDEFFVAMEGMQQIASGCLPASDECLHRDHLFQSEPRVGIARERGLRTAEHGALYNPSFIRTTDALSILYCLRGTPDGWRVPSTIALGGESRMASLERLPESDDPRIPCYQPASSDRVALVLLTPALFESDATNQPDDKSTHWFGAGPGQSARRLDPAFSGNVVTTSINRPQFIGGWNALTGGPEPLRPYAPAGTVWWLDNIPAKPGPFQIGRRTEHGYGLAICCKV